MSYTHNEVAHNWAHQTGRKSKGFAMFYEGDTIYSWGYHFPIAKFVTAPNGERVVLINKDSYSVSTSKHQCLVRRALGYQRDDAIYVPDLGRGNHHDWIRMIDKRLEVGAGKWKRARSRKDSIAASMRSDIETVNRLIDLWQLDLPKRTMPEDIAEFAASYEERRKAEQVKKDKKGREAIRKWLNGENVAPPHTRVPYVRVRRDFVNGPIIGQIVETSWGIKVPLAEALKLYRMSGLVRIVGKAWSPSKRHEVGGWPVDGISPDGTLKVGCHVIPYKVQQGAARLAGLEYTTLHTNEKEAA